MDQAAPVNRKDPTGSSPLLALSIVVPVYNEEGAIERLVEYLHMAAKRESGRSEIIIIDDGSRDKTVEKLEELTVRYPDLVVVALTRNFGQHAALSAGLDFSRGQWVMITDSDEGIGPDEFQKMLSEAQGEVKIVNGVLKKRNQTFLRRCSSRLAEVYLKSLFHADLTVWMSGQLLVEREAVDTVRRLPERSRNIHGLLSWSGYKTKSIEIARTDRLPPRRSGYRLLGLLRLFLEMVTAFSFRPVFWPFLFSIAALATAFVLNAIFFFWGDQLSVGLVVQASLIVLLLLTSLNLMFLGMLGVYIARINIQARLRPLYLVRKILGQNAPGGPMP